MSLREYITAEDTESAFRFFVGAALPLVTSTWLGYTEAGIFMMLGATFVFGIDVPIALPKKLGFMIFSGVLAAALFVLFTQSAQFPILNGILLIGVLFLLNFISPFSPNFSTVALFLNLSVMIGLSMSDSVTTLDTALGKARYLLIGSAWYTLYAMLLHSLQRPRQLRRRLQDCLRLTADYISGQTALLNPSITTQEIVLNLSKKQSEVVAQHQQIREVLLREPVNITSTETFMGQATYLLAYLVDMDELATASILSLQAIAGRPEKEKEELEPLLRSLNACIAGRLRQMADFLENQTSTLLPQSLSSETEDKLSTLDSFLNKLKIQTAASAQSAEFYRQMRRIQRYSEQQHLLLHHMLNAVANKQASLDVVQESLPLFAIYDLPKWGLIRSHLSFQSGFFRYALRMAFTAVGAYYMAYALNFGYPSWALLTVLVILKPGFSLSKQRLAHRVYGTMAGLVVGLGLHYLLQPAALLSMGIFLVSLFFAFSFIKRQYAITTGFFTIFILFFYSYLQREFMDAAFYRLLDTLVAAGLCWLSMRFVFPYWEVQNLPTVVKGSLCANRNLLKTILDQADLGISDPTAYKLRRKDAFLKMDDLLNSYRTVQTESAPHTDVLSTFQRVSLLIYIQLSQIVSLGLFVKRTPGFQWEDSRVRAYVQEALLDMEALLRSEETYFPSGTKQVMLEQQHQELTTRRHEIDRLLLSDNALYMPKVHELFWLESAYELIGINDKLREKLSPKPESSTAA
jgi:uncharacterized membrane protein YccC